jgi:MFS transporter, OFA family, oxalate/formate antiporter
MQDLKLFGLPAQQGRWLFIPLGIIAMLCMGTVYSWSIFRKPLEKLLTVGATESLLPFAVLLAVFAILMPIAGRYIERYGANKVTAIGGIVMGLGYFCSGFVNNIPLLIFTYGIIAGAGVGIAYGVPLAVAAKWFPDRRGLAVGLTVVGFGLSPLITAPIAKSLIETYEVSGTFKILGIAFTAIVLAIASQLRFPPVGWQPTSSTITNNPVSNVFDRPPATEDLLKSSSFYGLWICYVIGTLAGLMAIGISSNVATDVVKLDKNTATAAVSVFAIFNGIGRPIFGWLTDRLQPKMAAIISYMMILIASIIMQNTGANQSFNYFFAFGLFWLSLGGWLAIAPTATLSLFSPANYTKNYGVVFTAYGVGAIAGTLIAGSAKDIFGSYQFAFYPTAILAIVGIIVATFALVPATKNRQVVS